MKQLTIFDWMPELAAPKRPEPKEPPVEPEVGSWVETHGANICHIMRPSYIGEKVVMDKSTQSHRWYQVGILEDYFPYEGTYRAVIFDGSRQRNLITFRPGVEIYECLPWDQYQERMKAIFGENKK